MLDQILTSQIMKFLAYTVFFSFGLWALIKGKLFVRRVEEPINGVPARIIGGLTCLWSIAIASVELKIIDPTYKDIAMFIFIISFISTVTMLLLFSFINISKQ